MRGGKVDKAPKPALLRLDRSIQLLRLLHQVEGRASRAERSLGALARRVGGVGCMEAEG